MSEKPTPSGWRVKVNESDPTQQVFWRKTFAINKKGKYMMYLITVCSRIFLLVRHLDKILTTPSLEMVLKKTAKKRQQ